MRIVFVGSGGTGGYFGAKLARAGEDVTFVARGEHLAAIRADGLRIRSAVDGEWTVSLGRIVFGEMNGATSERATSFVEACKRAAIQGELVPGIRKTLWEKYVFLTALAGATAVTRLPVKFVRGVPDTRRLWELQVEELLALARAEKIGLDADTMARCVEFLESLAPTNYSSLYQDLMQGKRLELDALHGHAVRLGNRHGVPTPTLFAVYAALQPYLQGAPSPVA